MPNCWLLICKKFCRKLALPVAAALLMHSAPSLIAEEVPAPTPLPMDAQPELGRLTRLVLRGGAEITAPLLKYDKQTCVLDLGDTVLTIPAASILELTQPTEKAEETVLPENATYATGTPEVLSIADAAAKFAPAVVVVRTPRGLGSGFFVNRRGVLLTNFHIIRGERQITVVRFEREERVLRRIIHHNVKIVALDAFHDLAVLQVALDEKDPPITPVVFAQGDQAPIGEPVFAIGNPLGLERSVTQGVISQSARNINGLLFLQTDTPVNPGNSGGPLFNARGQVIGIINMQVPVMQGLNFAIPARHARFLLEHLDDYAFDETNPESGFLYLAPPRRAGAVSAAKHQEEKGKCR